MSQEIDSMRRQIRALEQKVAALIKDVALLKDRRGNDEYVPPVTSSKPRKTDDPVLRALLKPKSYVSLD